ncbi:uncharacterized protein [Ambystoma mexicanum]|uniref:uncharacterized protein isoform X2 n=1 Tax=Ambystoma mexicanum TaxID=8296 RepID=UPI0037E94930
MAQKAWDAGKVRDSKYYITPALFVSRCRFGGGARLWACASRYSEPPDTRCVITAFTRQCCVRNVRCIGCPKTYVHPLHHLLCTEQGGLTAMGQHLSSGLKTLRYTHMSR